MPGRKPSTRVGSRRGHGILTDRYRLGELVGAGGAADVYEGTDLRLGRSVAVKMFRPGADAVLEERFRDEAVLLARLQHPGLVTVYDAGRHEDRSYLIMQLVRGPTLRQELAATPMTPESVARLGVRLADALAHVHAAGIVHRDIKPSNILLDAERKPYLTDFGISRLIDATSHTAPGALVGTAAYLAPEQVLGKGAGSAADIYALGLLLLECLKGELEYSGPPVEAAVARLHRPPVIPDHMPAPLAGLLRDMTSADEAVRPDAHDCTATLTDFAMDPTAAPGPADPTSHLAVGDQGEGDKLFPLSTSPRGETPQPPTRASLPRRARTLLVGGTTLVALIGAALTTTALMPGGTSEQEAPTSPTSASVRHSTGEPSVGSSAPGPVRESAGKPSADSPGSTTSSGAPSHGQDSRSDKKAGKNAGQGGKKHARGGDAPRNKGPASTDEGKGKRR
ncbi:protein kinase [Streptomyces sp. NPDC058620]|uniref:serine/threonine-protein kinase n=1 Tax=Streptomyces sp. NPDC058620 TaxID=3346560 RepID=UPI003662FFF8